MPSAGDCRVTGTFDLVHEELLSDVRRRASANTLRNACQTSHANGDSDDMA
jgi:hypothetical protein